MSNMQNKRTLEFDVTDAPMMLHAMQIAANTAMMCGHPSARARFQQYRDFFKSLIPAEANFFGKEVWGEIGMALATAKTFRVYLDEDNFDKMDRARGRPRWNVGYCLFVQIGDTAWKAKYELRDMKAGDPRARAVHDLLQSLAPIDCVGVLDDQGITEAA